MDPAPPSIDAGAGRRLTARFGGDIEAWFDRLAGLLTGLAQRWRLELGSPIPRGSMSVVLHCRMADGRPAVLKASPDRARLAHEAAALRAWHTVHSPAVLALDERLGAMLVVPPDLYERGRALATRLARHDLPTVLLHGDLTPSNVLDGAAERGLVAIDPAPCLGDAAFDAVDLILWQADDLETIQACAERLAPATGMETRRMLAWCAAFAAMNALELASQGARGARIGALLQLARRAS